MIMKPLIGQIVLDIYGKKVWINSIGGCILRINNVNFVRNNNEELDENIIEKFNMIDINCSDSNSAVVLNNNIGSEKNINKFTFLEKSLFCLSQIDNEELQKEIIDFFEKVRTKGLTTDGK